MDKEFATLAMLRDAILKYLECHPSAADTVDGIGEWWLSEIRPKPSVGVLQEVLDGLVADGKINRSELVDGSVVYEKVRDPAA